jgi:hypothetical protein
MGTGTILDLRRTDLRTNVLENPYWITSAEITPDCDDQDAVLFSFPITKSISPGYGNNLIFIHQVAFEITTAFAGGTVALDIGQGSLATDAVTTGGTVTDVDPDMYLLDADITLGTKGWYLPTSGHTTAWLTDIAAKTFTTNITITPADATVLAVVAYLTSTDTITAGAARFHMLISELPSDR